MKCYDENSAAPGMPPLPHITPAAGEPIAPATDAAPASGPTVMPATPVAPATNAAPASGPAISPPTPVEPLPAAVTTPDAAAATTASPVQQIEAAVVELTEEEVTSIISAASRRHSWFSGGTIAASVSKFMHDPDSLHEFTLGIDGAMQAQIDRLHRHLTLRKLAERTSANPVKMAALPDDEGTLGSEQGDGRADEAPSRKRRPKP